MFDREFLSASSTHGALFSAKKAASSLSLEL